MPVIANDPYVQTWIDQWASTLQLHHAVKLIRCLKESGPPSHPTERHGFGSGNVQRTIVAPNDAAVGISIASTHLSLGLESELEAWLASAETSLGPLPPTDALPESKTVARALKGTCKEITKDTSYESAMEYAASWKTINKVSETLFTRYTAHFGYESVAKEPHLDRLLLMAYANRLPRGTVAKFLGRPTVRKGYDPSSDLLEVDPETLERYKTQLRELLLLPSPAHVPDDPLQEVDLDF
jgi:hypothetical protein